MKIEMPMIGHIVFRDGHPTNGRQDRRYDREAQADEEQGREDLQTHLDDDVLCPPQKRNEQRESCFRQGQSKLPIGSAAII